jgi:mRNA interferase MazF
MLTSGDVVDLDLKVPSGHEAGFEHPAVVVTAQRILAAGPSVVHVLPLTSTRRGYHSEVDIDPDPDNGLHSPSAAQCQHLRSVSVRRLARVRGNVGAVPLAQIREVVGLLLDVPTPV